MYEQSEDVIFGRILLADVPFLPRVRHLTSGAEEELLFPPHSSLPRQPGRVPICREQPASEQGVSSL